MFSSQLDLRAFIGFLGLGQTSYLDCFPQSFFLFGF
uniref:Uncharacterized protein n=1 Tax=Rhizophora mucronata TaxID=61149 RepID=A0A2P2PKY2_RHIMU